MDTFKSLSHINPEILYPIPNFKALDLPPGSSSDLLPPNKKIVFLSINRYERKKNLNLAIESFGRYSKYILLRHRQKPRTCRISKTSVDTKMSRLYMRL